MADILQQDKIDELLDLCDDLGNDPIENSIEALQNITTLLKNKPVYGTYDNIHITLNQSETSDIVSKLNSAITSLKSKD